MKPVFQMPFMCHQKWRASTYDGHAPDQDSIDLLMFTGASNVSAGQPVFASAAGTVIEAYDTDAESPPYGSVVTIDHGDGWKTQYVHLNDSLSVKKNQTVVRGQKIGVVGNVSGLEPHLHYVQLKNDQAVRVTFDGKLINVHAGAKQSNGKYPTQNLTSANCPKGTSKKTVGLVGGSATCQEGAAVRATVQCYLAHTGKTTTKRGPWVGAKGTSTVKCLSSQERMSNGLEIS